MIVNEAENGVKLYLIIILVLLSNFLNAQQIMTLEQCLDFALKNNISIQRYGLELEQNQAELLKNKLSLLPSLNGMVSQGISFGNSLDYTKYEYVRQSINSNYFSLNSDWTLFNGLRIQNNIQAGKHNLEAGNYNMQDIQDQISLNVVSTYLYILMNMEQLKFAQNQLELTKKLYERAQLLVEVGQETKSKELELKAQFAKDDVSLIEASNNLEQSYLSLKQLLNWDISKDLVIEKLDLDLSHYEDYSILKVEEFIEQSIENQPKVKHAMEKLESASYNYKATKGLLYPSLGLSASTNTRYSSSKNPITGIADPFNDQINNNMGESVNLGLNIPIFNNFQNNYSLKMADINLKNALLNLEESRINARNAIYEAYYMLMNEYKKFESAKRNLEAQQLLFEQANVMYDEGVMNFYEGQGIKNNLSLAESSFLQSKFDFG